MDPLGFGPLGWCFGMAHHQVLIVGGGAAGITAAAQLKRARPQLEVAILEPSADHYYQPGWTLVGAGVFSLDETRRAELATEVVG